MIKFEKDVLNHYFYEYLSFIQRMCCDSCHFGYQHHHRGCFAYLLNQNPKISKDNFLMWLYDLDHGFLHGLLVGFWCYLQIEKKEI
jgi:hypothetical protein